MKKLRQHPALNRPKDISPGVTERSDMPRKAGPKGERGDVTTRYADSANPAAKEMGRLAGETVNAWGDDTPFPTTQR